MNSRHIFGAVVTMATLLALPAATFAGTPGPPDVDVLPPEVIVTDRGDQPVGFVPGLITFTFTDGTETSCVIDPALPPNPCSELATNPGPPDVEIVPPEALVDDGGTPVGFIPGLVLITFADGTQLSCVIDPGLPPSPCAEATR